MQKTQQANSAEINQILLEKYYKPVTILENWDYTSGYNSFLAEFLKYFTHIDTYVSSVNKSVRLQGWFKPTDSCILPECLVNGFDPEMGIMIADLTIYPF